MFQQEDKSTLNHHKRVKSFNSYLQAEQIAVNMLIYVYDKSCQSPAIDVQTIVPKAIQEFLVSASVLLLCKNHCMFCLFMLNVILTEWLAVVGRLVDGVVTLQLRSRLRDGVGTLACQIKQLARCKSSSILCEICRTILDIPVCDVCTCT